MKLLISSSLLIVIFYFSLLNQNKTKNKQTLFADRLVVNNQIKNDVPINVKMLMRNYNAIKGYKDNKLIFSDNSTMVYDDGIKSKTNEQLLNNPDIEDQFIYDYPKGNIITNKHKKNDPGRIRNEKFFKKIYGENCQDVKKNLTTVIWCPKLVNQKILVTKVNKVDERIRLISAELDKLPQFKKYLQNIGGTFNWRNIKGTNRLSMHSFGMTIDLNTKYSNYWQWDCSCTNEKQGLTYNNRIPQEIVDIFEKNGFIWGGKWEHYDTMHFEFRPELLNINAYKN